ncbi:MULTISPECIES: DUF3024 domain-containing protein [Thioalkalivibrio]|uniref:DUF3024 domain-containing protein n=1 Tax=Thioalkalivibrio TaxID=106633 RepID=UPI0003668A97|nr:MULTISPECIES: DUF3024 domain-containing protein [Thioalkalivibrio]OOC50231.1 hypothetical protein B0684_02765 [Thioalkalivibrio versutus]
MALSELERKRIEKLMEAFMERRRPPAHVRDRLDFVWRLEGQSVSLYEVRPLMDDASRIVENPVFKATFVRKSGRWKLYWQRADLKWHGYDPHPELASLEDVLQVVEKDEYACFFG